MKTFSIKNSFILVFALLAFSYIFTGYISDIDFAVDNYLSEGKSPALISFYEVFTKFGDWYVVLILTALFSYFLWKVSKAKNFDYLQMFWVILVGGLATSFILKIIFWRERPFGAEFYEGFTSAFPSNHAMDALIFFGFIAYFIYKLTDWRASIKFFWVSFLSLVVLLVGFSRLYLGVHYLSDIVAGYLIAWFWLNAGIRKAQGEE